MIKHCLIFIFLISLIIVTGCERRPLEERETDMAEVCVELDWSRASINPQEATVIFYDEKGNSPRTLYVIGTRGTVKLPVGIYSVIAFNDKIGDFAQFAFRGTSYYKTIEVYATEMSKPNKYYSGALGGINEDTYDVLASDSRDYFEVTQEMLDETRAKITTGNKAESINKVHLIMTPSDVVAATKITIHFKNMHLIRTGSQRAQLTGFAESVTLWNRKTSSVFMTHSIPLSYAEYYDGSSTDGYMREMFSTFGICTPMERTQPINFLFEAILRDKEQTKISYRKDITNLIVFDMGNNMKINIEIGGDPDKGNPSIKIPLIDPIDNSAFKPGVEGWEEEEIIKPL